LKKFISRVKAIFFGIFVSLLLCEIFLRIYNPFPFALKEGKLILPANQSKIFENKWISKLDKRIHYSRNSLGFRGPEPPDSISRLLSIITVGGSTTECKFLSDSCTWPSVLYQKLHAVNSKVWLNNAGIDGHSTFGHLLLLKEYLIKLKPKYILFLTGINDVENDAPDQFDLMNEKRINTLSFKSFAKSLLNHTELGRTAFNFYAVELAYKKGLVHREINPANLLAHQLTNNIVDKRLFAQKTYLLRYSNRIDSLINLCKQAGIQPVFITQPSLYGSYTDPATGIAMGNKWSDNTEQTNCDLEGKILALYNDVLRSHSKDIPVIDLAAEMPKNSVYYYDFIHFTNAGAQKVADILFDNLAPIIFSNTSK
jgi:lysophospholipase L1-like esterase